MSIDFIVVGWCLLLMTTQASASVSANSTEVSISEVPSANTTVSKVKDKNETSEETAETFLFNPEGNITFSGNSSSEVPFANTTVFKKKDGNETSEETAVTFFFNPEGNLTFSRNSSSEVPSVNTTVFKKKDGNETSDETALPYFFNPEGNITFSGNSSSEVPSANTTVSKVKDKNETSEETSVPFFSNPEGNVTFSGNSSSEVPSANTTVFKKKDGNETSEETAAPFFFNPEGNITFSGNSSLLIKEDVSSPLLMSFRSRRTHRRRKSKGKRRYFISEFKASWLKAMQSCRSRDMQLITINCNSEQKVLHELLKENRIKTPIWTSGSDNGGGKDFYWISSGSRLKYKNWRRGQPDGMDRGSKHGSDHCVQVSPEDYYDWNDYTCFTKNYFVCEKDV